MVNLIAESYKQHESYKPHEQMCQTGGRMIILFAFINMMKITCKIFFNVGNFFFFILIIAQRERLVFSSMKGIYIGSKTNSVVRI